MRPAAAVAAGLPITSDRIMQEASFRAACRRAVRRFGGARPFAALGLAVISAAAASIWAAPGLRGWLGAVLAAIMLLIAAIDARSYIIPDKLSLAGLAFGVFHAGALSAEPVLVA